VGEAARTLEALRWLADDSRKPTRQQLAEAEAILAEPPANDPQASLAFPNPFSPLIEKETRAPRR
jgi:hypothetical protein